VELVSKEKIEGMACAEVSEDEAEELFKKGEEMIELCRKEEGIGLAAPQVGIYKNMIIKREMFSPRFEIIFNPTFYRDGGKTRTIEGCLTYPGQYYYLKRFKRIGVIYYLWNGYEFIKKTKKTHGMESFVWQHEIDHLKGKTIATKGELVDEDKIRKRKTRDGEEIKVPKL
jgi:peptide deformylase